MKASLNPFSSRHIESLLYSPTTLIWDEIMERLSSLNNRAVIVGREGTGKTTLLEEIGKKLKLSGYEILYYRLDQKDQKPISYFIKNLEKNLLKKYAILLDGPDKMSYFSWKLCCLKTRKAGAFIATSHKPGYFPILLTTNTSPELLHKLICQLLKNKDMISLAEIQRLFDFHKGNIRLIFRELYDKWADKFI